MKQTEKTEMHIVIKDITPEGQAERFVKYRRMAAKIAEGMSRRHGIPFEEVRDEAESILSLALCDGWVCDTALASECTWVYKKVYWPLLTFCTRGKDRYIPFSSLGGGEDGEFDAPAKSHPIQNIQNMLRNLSDDAAYLVKTIIHAPVELADDITAPWRAGAVRAAWGDKDQKLSNMISQSRSAVRAFLEGTEGWTSDHFDRVWTEVDACLG